MGPSRSTAGRPAAGAGDSDGRVSGRGVQQPRDRDRRSDAALAAVTGFLPPPLGRPAPGRASILAGVPAASPTSILTAIPTAITATPAF
jgi:hypothetical protein